MSGWRRIAFAVSIGFGVFFVSSMLLGVIRLEVFSVLSHLIDTAWYLELRAVYTALPGLLAGFVSGRFAQEGEIPVAICAAFLGSLPHGLALERIQDGDWAYFIPNQLVPILVAFSLGGYLARRHRLRREARAEQAIIDTF